MPSTVWIWSLKLLRPYAVLVHLNPIKSIEWHPTISDLLMIQCTGDSDSTNNIIYLWNAAWKQPKAIHIPMEKVTGSSWAKWVLTKAPGRNASTASSSSQPFTTSLEPRSHSPEKEVDRRPRLLFGDKDGFIIGYVEDEPIPEDVVEQDKMGERAEPKPMWSAVDWGHYASAQDVNRRGSGLLASQASAVPSPLLRMDNSKIMGTLPNLTEKDEDSLMSKNSDDTFEHRNRKNSVSVR